MDRRRGAGHKGYHQAESLAVLREVHQVRTYIPEQTRQGHRVWVDKPTGQQAAVYANRRRCAGTRGRALSRQRSEHVERSFAHTCETGGARRTWLRGLTDVAKRYWVHAGAHNLGALMRVLFGVGTPRSLQGYLGALSALLVVLWTRLVGNRDAHHARQATDAASHAVGLEQHRTRLHV